MQGIKFSLAESGVTLAAIELSQTTPRAARKLRA